MSLRDKDKRREQDEGHTAYLEFDCSTCEGCGYVDDPDVTPVTDLDNASCDTCDGRGRVARTGLLYRAARYTYTGLHCTFGNWDEDPSEARSTIARLVRQARNAGRPVTRLEPNADEAERWELGEDPNGVIIDDRAGIVTIDTRENDDDERCDGCGGNGWLPEHCGRCGEEITEASYFGVPRGNEATYRSDSGEITCADCVPTRIQCPDCEGEEVIGRRLEHVTVTDLTTGAETTRQINGNGCSCCGFERWSHEKRGDDPGDFVVIDARVVDVDGIYFRRLCVQVSELPEKGGNTGRGAGGCWEGAERAAPDHPKQTKLDVLGPLLDGDGDGLESEMTD